MPRKYYGNRYGNRLACTSSQLWFTTKSYLYGGDSIIVYRSTDKGTNWSNSGKFNVPGIISPDYFEYAYDICPTSNSLYIYYSSQSLSITSSYKRIVTTASIGSETKIGNFVVINANQKTSSAWIRTTDNTIRRNSNFSSNTWDPNYFFSYEFNNSYSDRNLFIASDNLYFITAGAENGVLRCATVKYMNKPKPWNTIDSVTIYNQLDITWKSYWDTTTYRFQLSKLTNFSNFLLDTAVSSDLKNQGSITIKDLSKLTGSDSGKVFFRIRADNGSYISDWSDLRSISYKVLLQPALLTPVDKATFPNVYSDVFANIKFEWTFPNNADSYWFQLYKDSNFTTYAKDLSTGSSSYYSFYYAYYYSNIKLYWRVKARGPMVAPYVYAWESNWSEVRTVTIGTPTSITNDLISFPQDFSLKQNYPNPFNPATNIYFSIPILSNINLTVFDQLGREVIELINEQRPAGSYSVTWNASRMAGGIYFYRLSAGNYADTKKMILLK